MEKKTSIIWITVLFLFSIVYIARAADSTINLDFSSGIWNGQTYEQDGFVVTPVSGTEINLQDGWIWATLGTIEITRIDGTFDLLSFDVSVGSTDVEWVGMGFSFSNGVSIGGAGVGMATNTPTAPSHTLNMKEQLIWDNIKEEFEEVDASNLTWVRLGGGVEPGFISWDNIKVKITLSSSQETEILDFLPAILAGVLNTDNDGDDYSENQGDCNDSDSSIYPGALEICGDGIDQNCDGLDLDCTTSPCPCFSLSDINNATGNESFPDADCTDGQELDGFFAWLDFYAFEFVIWFLPETHGAYCFSGTNPSIETSLEEAQACRQNIVNSNIWLNPDENCWNR